MYIPKHFSQADSGKLLAFIRQYNFGIVVNTDTDGTPVATHLPFIIEQRNEEVVLVSHMALANKQWQTFSGSPVLVIFSEPHAYISPSFYDKKQNVPTWNFIAVHCYGIPVFIEGEEALESLMEKTINSFEPAYLNQFRQLDRQYVTGLLRGIKGFEIKVQHWEGKYKLSQNKTEAEQLRIIHAFENSSDDNQIAIAKFMKEQLQKKND